MTRVLRLLACSAVAACVARLALGPAVLGYDAWWSLVWGRDLVEGVTPPYNAPIAPTPHPLTNAVAALLEALPVDAAAWLAGITWLAFGATVVLGWQLGRRVGGRGTATVLVGILISRPLLVSNAQISSLDVWFLALMLAALVVAASDEQRPRPVLLLLALAGTLRPEAWLLVAVYWLVVCTSRRDRWPLAALGASGALVWALSDLAITGDPFHSLHVTRDLADLLGRPQTAGFAAGGIAEVIEVTLGTALFLAGVGGLLLDARAPRPVLHGARGLLACSLVAFVGYGVAGLPVLGRYALLPSVALAIFAAVLLTRARGPALLAVIVLGGWALTQLPGTLDDIERRTDAIAARSALFDDLRDVVDQPAFRAALERCPVVVVPNHRLVPILAVWLDRRLPAGIVSQQLTVPPRGLAISPATLTVLNASILDQRDPFKTPRDPPRGYTFGGGNRSWVWSLNC